MYQNTDEIALIQSSRPQLGRP